MDKIPSEEDDVDPLDAYMSGLETVVPQPSSLSGFSKYDVEDDHDTHLETFAKERAKKNALSFKQSETLEELEYDSDDMPTLKKRVIESLAPLDHHSLSYESFNKVLYKESISDSKMTEAEVAAARKALKISVTGSSLPRLISTFTGFHFPETLLAAISSEGFERPTPIQMQAVPVAMCGRDVLGIAATGSGKTLSFVWPMLVHVYDQRTLRSSESGPIGIIVAPTRELANQIYDETKKFAKCFQRLRGDKWEKAIRVAPLMGGLGRGDTRQMLKSSPHEIVVATPGRLIDMIKTKLISTFRTTMLVLDEADKMFDMGFEPQIRSIVGQIRPDRQTLLFSATFKPSVENLARDILTNPVKITVGGTVGGANQDVTQVVEILRDDDAKWLWLAARLQDFTLDGSVLIFAGSKIAVEDLAKRLREQFPALRVAALHGDKSADERTQIMQDFKNEKFQIMVATDLAARGLDVKSIRTVVNYQSAKDIDSHTHRIGRTGRAGDKFGFAYTLLAPSESSFASMLVKNLENAKQDVPHELLAVAQRNPKFRLQAVAPPSFSSSTSALAHTAPYVLDSPQHQQWMRNVNPIAPLPSPSSSSSSSCHSSTSSDHSPKLSPADTPDSASTLQFVKSAQPLQTVVEAKQPASASERYDPFAAL